MSTVLKENINIPTQFRCALTNNLMLNPVRISGSKNQVAYEKEALLNYWEDYGLEDPQTKQQVEEEDVIVDYALKRQIEHFIDQYKAPEEEDDLLSSWI